MVIKNNNFIKLVLDEILILHQKIKIKFIVKINKKNN